MPFMKGRYRLCLNAPLETPYDLAIWYTPGVAQPCKEIKKNPKLVFKYTNRWNHVAVVSDGTRVLGLGDIGPEAAYQLWRAKPYCSSI